MSGCRCALVLGAHKTEVLAAVNGTPISDATITVAPPHNKTFHFKNLMVSSLMQSSTNETVTLNFSGMKIEYASPSTSTPTAAGAVESHDVNSTSLQLPPLTTAAGMVPAGRGGATPSAPQSSQSCVELRMGAGAAVRYVLQGEVSDSGWPELQLDAGPADI
jgi:hypothetical protein